MSSLRKQALPAAAAAAVLVVTVGVTQALNATSWEFGTGESAESTMFNERRDRNAVQEGQAPPAEDPFVLAKLSDDPDALTLVGYSDARGSLCLGWVNSRGTGLPSGCDPHFRSRDDSRMSVAQFAEHTATGDDVGDRYVWGSVPRQTSYVVLRYETGNDLRFDVTTHEEARFADRRFFVALVPGLGRPDKIVAFDERDREIASKD